MKNKQCCHILISELTPNKQRLISRDARWKMKVSTQLSTHPGRPKIVPKCIFGFSSSLFRGWRTELCPLRPTENAALTWATRPKTSLTPTTSGTSSPRAPGSLVNQVARRRRSRRRRSRRRRSRWRRSRWRRSRWRRSRWRRSRWRRSRWRRGVVHTVNTDSLPFSCSECTAVINFPSLKVQWRTLSALESSRSHFRQI